MSLWANAIQADNCLVDPPANAPKEPEQTSRLDIAQDGMPSKPSTAPKYSCASGNPIHHPTRQPRRPSPTVPANLNILPSIQRQCPGWENVTRIVNETVHIDLKDFVRPRTLRRHGPRRSEQFRNDTRRAKKATPRTGPSSNLH